MVATQVIYCVMCCSEADPGNFINRGHAVVTLFPADGQGMYACASQLALERADSHGQLFNFFYIRTHQHGTDPDPKSHLTQFAICKKTGHA